ncbi:variable large family protein (plasmid) [Borrelia turicatae]|nr:variable large family protein [Borrelia turicatae]
MEDPKTLFLTSIANLGKGFLDVFTSFSDMVAGAFGIKADTKKSDIGKYFTDIANTMNTVKAKLNDVVAKNDNYPKVKSVVDTFITNTLDKIADGAKIAATGATGEDKIGGVPKEGQDASPAEVASVNALVKGIKTIVGVVLKAGEGNAGATKTGDTEKKSIGKLLGKKDDGTEAVASAASASVGAVTGADILQAIAKSGEATSEAKIETAKDAASIAAAKVEESKSLDAAKEDAVIAAGIALRSMAKDGKFAVKTGENEAVKVINGAVSSAVNKTLSTLIIAIRNTVDSGLKSINAVLATVTQEDKSLEAITPADAATGGQKQ